jgi:hypothetical protein
MALPGHAGAELIHRLGVLRRVADKDYCEHKVILGTHTNKAETNYLMVATVRLPREDAEIDASKYDEERGGKRFPANVCCERRLPSRGAAAAESGLVFDFPASRLFVLQSWVATAALPPSSRLYVVWPTRGR